MENVTFDSDQRALAYTRDALAGLGPIVETVSEAEREHAVAIARIVAHFDPDPVAVGGTLLQALWDAPPGRDDPRYATLDPSIVDFAAALARLGRTDLPVRGIAHRYTAAQAEGLRRMLLAVVSDPRLVLARVAEQLCRLRAAHAATAEEQAHLGRETQELYAPLANRLGLASLKWELEDYAFRYLEPTEYKRIASALAEKRGDRERYIEDLKRALEADLRAAGIDADVQGRPKHLYSIFRKMRKKGLRFEELYDVRAVRVLVDTVAHCYAALGVVHSLYPYLPGEFDDYIATPKANGYRSIHTAVSGPGDKTVEVQIRTRDMHERAESGVAAHWRYKEGSRRDDALERKVEDLRRLLQPSGADDDPLASVGQVVFRERIYVFSPKGDVVELPDGATPLDFAYQVHTSLGHRCRGARVDGRMVPLDHRLTSGVTVDIITAKEAQPSRDWLIESLGFLASRSAKAKVRAFFRQADRDDHLRTGRAISERELGRRATTADIAALAAMLGVAGVDELYVALGSGDLSGNQLAAAQVRRDKAAKNADATLAPAPIASTAPESADGIHAMGVGDLLSHYARCCHPIPPEPVTGYVTLGRGITIHRTGCRNLTRLASAEPDRLIPVTWSQHRERDYACEFQVRAFDRRGLVRDVSALLADARLSIQHMSTTTNPDGIADMRVATRVHDLDELERCLARIRGLPDIIRAQRY
jgi:GTP pyrophosphokinase